MTSTRSTSNTPLTAVAIKPIGPKREQRKDQPLIDDIRLLGRLLGDVIREQEGAEAFE